MKSIQQIICILAISFLTVGCASWYKQNDLVWIDVRSDEEYQEQHLEGAINIEYTEILEGVANLDKDTEILLYCGSGRRAGIALEALEAQGFTNVTNHGGLADVLEQQAN